MDTTPIRSRLLAAIGAVALIGAVIGATVVVEPAFAQGRGAGYHGDLGDLGAYIANDGSEVYCLQLGNERTAGDHPTDGGSYGQWGGDANANARVNYILTNYGQTGDNNTAAAVAMYVWDQLDNGAYNSHGMSGDIYYVGRAPSSQQNTILSILNGFRSQAAGITANSGPRGQMTFQVDGSNNYLGTLTVSGVGGAVGTITLTNGIFTANGTTQIGGVGDGSVLSVRGVPPQGTPDYRISATGAFTDPGAYAGDVKIYNIIGGGQAVAGAGERSAFQLTANDPFDRSTTFRPVLVTNVDQPYIGSGDAFSDNVDFATTNDANGLNNDWPQRADGSYLPIVANAKIYGPFAQQPTQAAFAPAGAPLAGSATVTTGSAGPNVGYPVTSDDHATTPGYYTWVWTIRYDDQPAITQLYLDEGYSFTDDFGQSPESQIVPPAATTKADPTGLLGIPAHDTATITGPVFHGAQLGFKAYLQGVTPPVVQPNLARPQVNAQAASPAAAPADPPVCAPYNQVFSSALQPIPASGDYKSPDALLPVGTILWVETIYDASGQAVQSGTCGDDGETTVVSQLAVTTTATPGANTGDAVHDTATITGTINTGDTIAFAAYTAPSAGNQPLCDATTQVYDSGPQALTAGVVNPATVDGPSTTFAKAGDYLWVETITSASGQVLAQGTCGDVHETTHITSPPKTLALTGLDEDGIAYPSWVGLGAILGGLMLGGWSLIRRRRAEATR